METRPLKIEDVNNKLQCSGFTVIHFAPPPGAVKDEDFDRVYLVQRKEESILVKLVDFARVPFCKIGSVLTIPATGWTADVWRKEWLRRHANTKDDTEMAVYCYVKQSS